MTTDTTSDKPSSARKVIVAAVEEFPPGTRMEIKVGRRIIAIFNIDGDYYAIHGLCPHQQAPLSRGRLQGTVICNAETDWETEWAYDGEVVVCPGHAMEFHVKTGQAFGYSFKLRRYEVILEDNQVKLII